MLELELYLILLDIDLRHLNIYFPPAFPFNFCQIFTSGSGAQDRTRGGVTPKSIETGTGQTEGELRHGGHRS